MEGRHIWSRAEIKEGLVGGAWKCLPQSSPSWTSRSGPLLTEKVIISRNSDPSNQDGVSWCRASGVMFARLSGRCFAKCEHACT